MSLRKSSDSITAAGEEIEEVKKPSIEWAIPTWKLADDEQDEIHCYAETYYLNSANRLGQRQRWKLIPLCGKVSLTPAWQTLNAKESFDSFMNTFGSKSNTKWMEITSDEDERSLLYYYYRKKDKHGTWQDIEGPLNIGICTGSVNGFIVLDVDVKKDGPETLDAILEANELEMPITWTTETGSGGFHYYFQYDPDFRNATDLNSFSGLDLKTDGGYVVSAGSTHPSTLRYYRWKSEREPWRVELAIMPQKLKEALLGKQYRKHAKKESTAKEAAGLKLPKDLLYRIVDALEVPTSYDMWWKPILLFARYSETREIAQKAALRYSKKDKGAYRGEESDKAIEDLLQNTNTSSKSTIGLGSLVYWLREQSNAARADNDLERAKLLRLLTCELNELRFGDSTKAENNRSLIYPSEDAHWKLIIAHSHDGHAKLFHKLAADRCFSRINPQTVWIFDEKTLLYRECDLSALAQEITSINGPFIRAWIDDMKQVWLPKLKDPDIDPKLKAELKELCKQAHYKNPGDTSWSMNVAKQVIFLIEDTQRAEKVDNETNVVPCYPDSIVDCKSGKTRKRTAKDLFTLQIPYAYDPNPHKRADAIRDKIMDQWTAYDKKQLALVKLIFGSGLTGIANRRQFYYIVGLPGTGKSFIIKILMKVYGMLGREANRHAFVDRKEKSEITPALVVLQKCRLVVVAESKGEDAFDDEALNKIVGGDMLHCRNPHGKEIMYRPNYIVIMVGNKVPEIKNLVLLEKILPIRAKAKFVKGKPNEENYVYLRIINFEHEVINDDEVMQSFLRWFVEGAIEFNDNHCDITPTKESEQLICELRRETDILQMFLDKECQVSSKLKIKRSVFHDAFQSYFSKHRRSNTRSMTPQEIGKQMKEKGFEVRKISVEHYIGVCLLEKGVE